MLPDTINSTHTPAIASFLRLLIFLFVLPLYGAFAQTSYVFTTAVDVGSSTDQAVPVIIQTAGTLATVEVLTTGIQNLDFTPTSTPSTGSAYSHDQTYTISIHFAPKYPGARFGAIVLLDSTGNIMATQPLFGIGTGPLSVMAAGEITTIAGNGNLEISSNGSSSALQTGIGEPLGVVVDGAGNVYYSDSDNNLIRRIDASTEDVTTIAGTGIIGYSPNGTLAVNAEIGSPSGLAIDGAGNIYFADMRYNVVREIVAANGEIFTTAGSGILGYSGDNGPASTATLNNPQGLGFDSSGNLYIADSGNNVIRKVNAENSFITTFAGTGTAGYSGDGGSPASATLNAPWSVVVAPDGSLYISDNGSNVIRKVNSSGTTIATFVGTGTAGYSGDGGPPIQAELNGPTGLAVDAAGNLFIADSENSCIRKVVTDTATSTTYITTIAGTFNYSGYNNTGGDGQDANLSGLSQLYLPFAVALDSAGNYYIADRLNLRIREVYANIASFVYPAIKFNTISSNDDETQAIENDGNATLNFPADAAIASANATVDAANTTCPGSAVQPGDQCSVGADFTPTVVGSPVNTSITVTNSNSPVATQSINMSGDSLNVYPTTITLTSSDNPAGLGTTITFSALVTTTNPQSISGNVRFYDGTTLLGGVPQSLNSTTNIATYSSNSFAVGSHTITASYSGDSNDSASSSSPLTQVIQQTTTFTLTGSPNPSTVYEPVTFVATLSTNSNFTTAPTGTVVFYSDGLPITGSTIPLNSGSAVLTTKLLPQGNHQITAVYSGDSIYPSTTSNSYLQTVNLAASATILSSSYASVYQGTDITFIATVIGVPGSTPTGNVTFYADGTVISGGTASLGLAGTASFTVSTLAVGTHNITAVYQGDSNYAGSTSAATVVTIVPVPNITISSSPISITQASGQHTTLTLTLSTTNGFTDTFSLGCLGLPKSATCTFSQDQITLLSGVSQTVTVIVDTGNPLSTQLGKPATPKSNARLLLCALPGSILLLFVFLHHQRLRSFRTLLLLLCMAAISAGVSSCGNTITISDTPAGKYTFDINAVGLSGVSQSIAIPMTITQ